MIGSDDQRESQASPRALLAHLRQAEQILGEMGAGYAGFRDRLAGLAARLDEGRFHLAVLGQFKRGKSSILNALLGEPLLPTGVLPLTAVPTVLRYGPERRVWVTRLDGRVIDVAGVVDEVSAVLRRYVTEEGNPGNRLGVTRVVVEHQAPFLAKGVEIIDTPGIGSTILHNTETTQRLLPQCDAALFVVSADPPITEVEVEFLKTVKAKVSRLIFVMNKVDYLSSRERQKVVEFLRGVLQDSVKLEGEVRIFEMSALRALEARSHAASWTDDGGLGELESYLGEFLVTEKEAALQDAIVAKASGLLSETLLALDLERKVLELPAADLERRIDLFDARLADLDRERIYFIDRLTGDHGRAREFLDGLADNLQGQMQSRLREVAAGARAALGTRSSGREMLAQVRRALAEAVPLAFDAAQADMTAAVDRWADEVLTGHVKRAEAFVNRIRQTAADLFEVPHRDLSIRDPFQVRREPFWVQQQWVTSFGVAALEWIEHLLLASLRVKRFERRVEEDIKVLTARNVENLRSAILQDLDLVFRLFQSRMEAHIAEAIRTTRGAIEAAQARQRTREETRGPEIARAAGYRNRLVHVARLIAPQEPLSDERGPL